MAEAAYKLFSEQGYSAPLTAIASEAGVAVQTIYFTFHTKPALLQEALTLAVLGDERPLAPHEREWFQELVAEPDPRLAIGILVDNTQAIFQRVAPLLGVFRTSDPDVASMWQHSEDLRHDGYRKVMTTLAGKAPLKEGLTVVLAADVLFALLSPDLYRLISVERGWGPKRWSAWIKGVLADALFGPRPVRKKRR
jgi:AcrR family transcriptional regulator